MSFGLSRGVVENGPDKLKLIPQQPRGGTMSVLCSISAAKPDRPVGPYLPEDGPELWIPARGARKPLGMVQPALESLDSPGPRAVISRGEAAGTTGAVPLINATPRRKRPGFFLFRELGIWGFEGLGRRHPGNRAVLTGNRGVLKGIGRCGGPPQPLPRLARNLLDWKRLGKS
jgi:hypothetical protein